LQIAGGCKLHCPGYYHSGDRTELLRQTEAIDEGIAALAEGLPAATLEKGETLEDRITRILKETLKRQKR
jgi:hypothetical protein